MKKLILITLLTISYPLFSQQYFNTRFGFGIPSAIDQGFNVFETDDGYVISGGTGGFNSPNYFRFGLAKFSFDGNMEIKKSWGDTNSVYIWYSVRYGSLIYRFGSYYTINGRWSSILRESKLVRYDNSLDTISTKTFKAKEYPFDTTYIIRNFIGVSNGFMVTGTRGIIYSKNKNAGTIYAGQVDDLFQPVIAKRVSQVYELFLLQLDSLGNVLWEKNFPDSLQFGQGFSIIQTTDGGFAIGAYKWVIGSFGASVGDPVVIKTDSLGNKEWELSLGGPYQDGTAILCQSEDGNILAASRFDMDSIYYNRYESRVQLTKIDNSGNVLWNHLYGDKAYYESVSNIRPTGNGVIISGSHWHPAPNRMGFMLRVDSLGDSLWYRQYAVAYGENSLNYLYDAIPTGDGGFLGAGYCLPAPPDTGNQDAWIIKVDSMGCTSLNDCWVGQQEIKTTKNGKKLLSVYPNPASVTLTIKIDNLETGSYKIDIFNIYGSKVKEINVPRCRFETTVNVADWKKGIYVIRVRGDNGQTSSRKIILTW